MHVFFSIYSFHAKYFITFSKVNILILESLVEKVARHAGQFTSHCSNFFYFQFPFPVTFVVLQIDCKLTNWIELQH